MAGHPGRLRDRRSGRRGRSGASAGPAGLGDGSVRADVALPSRHRRAGTQDSRQAASRQEDRESRAGSLGEGGLGPELAHGRLTGPAHGRREPWPRCPEEITFYDIDSRPIDKHLTHEERRLYLKDIKADLSYFKRPHERADLDATI